MEKTFCNKLEYMTDYLNKTDFYMYMGPAARIRAYKVPKDYFTCKYEIVLLLHNQHSR